MDPINIDVEPNVSDDPEELISRLESIQTYGTVTPDPDEPPAIFDDEQEPSSGLIDLIRKNSQVEEQPTTVRKSTETKKWITEF